MAKKVSLYGLFISLAFMLSYLELLFPTFVYIPGVKLGLANLVVFIALYTQGYKAAIMISVFRIILVGFTFSNLFTMLYSLSGGITSLLAMILFKKLNLFNKITVSIVGSITHNVAQLIVAILLVGNVNVLYYMPVLLISGIITGYIIGLLSITILNHIKPILKD